MDPITHVVTGVALSQFVSAPSRGWAALAGVFFAILPDLDYVITFKDRLAFLKHHRGFSHSLTALFLFALLAACLGRLLGGPRWFRPLLIIGILVLGSHLFLDWTTSYGTQLLNPFTRAKFTLDWLFIIDPYVTALLTAAALTALLFPAWGRTVGAAFLGLACAYILLCGFYHHQALNLARQAYRSSSGERAAIAALPQPFSPRRWLLVAATPREVRQAFVELPVWPVGEKVAPPADLPVHPAPLSPPRAPLTPYRAPGALEVFLWQAAPATIPLSAPDIRWVLDTYLEFCRFPLLVANAQVPGGATLTWMDGRFSVPGRALPFVLQLHVDQGGRLDAWDLGGARLPLPKASASCGPG